jgi:phage host-nuclease inhibitor protein Gam
MAPEKSAALALVEAAAEAQEKLDRSEQYMDEERPEVRTGHWNGPQSLEELDWVLMRIAEIQAEVEENKRLLRAAIAHAESRIERLNERAEHGVAFLTGHAKLYLRQHRDEILKHGKKKSRTLVYGTVGFRSRGDRLAVMDENALAAWAQDQGLVELVRIKVEPDIRAIRDYAEEKGIIPPGMAEQPQVDEPYIKPDVSAALVAPKPTKELP